MSPAWLALALALSWSLVAGCDRGSEPRGGAQTLPGPLPAGVTFASPPADAPPAPELLLELVDGTPLEGSRLWEDRPVVLLFTAPWCERCAELHRRVDQLVRSYDGAVTLLAVTRAEDRATVPAYAASLGLEHPVAVDAAGTMWRRYGVREPPLIALISQGGKLVAGWPGADDTRPLETALAELVPGRS